MCAHTQWYVQFIQRWHFILWYLAVTFFSPHSFRYAFWDAFIWLMAPFIAAALFYYFATKKALQKIFFYTLLGSIAKWWRARKKFTIIIWHKRLVHSDFIIICKIVLGWSYATFFIFVLLKWISKCFYVHNFFPHFPRRKSVFSHNHFLFFYTCSRLF